MNNSSKSSPKEAMKVAVVGTGIAGLSAAYRLAGKVELSVFEAEDRMGGHTATKNVSVGGKDYAIDTGFIVFNEKTYPNFIALMDELGVASQVTEMSFSVSCQQTGLEYSGSNLDTLFAQRKNIVSPYFLGMVRDILRFNREAVEDLDRGDLVEGQTLGEYLREKNYCEGFKQHYLLPMGSAIWSSGMADMDAFPALFFIRFFKNHGLLQVANRPRWFTLIGGSNTYLEPLIESFKSRIQLSSPVSQVRRAKDGVYLTVLGEQQRFDQVILACHSDTALKMLSDSSDLEQDILGALPYRENDVVLHTDESLLPKIKKTWSSWNYLLDDKAGSRPILTYDMNILQCLDAPETFCVTLNDEGTIDPKKVLGRYRYAHPVFSLEGIKAQARWAEINGGNRTWFAGAYWANGFHEDGVKSGFRAAAQILKILARRE